MEHPVSGGIQGGAPPARGRRRAHRLTVALLLALGACAPAEVQPNLVLIVLDTVGPSHVSAYGYAEPTTPFLERFASQGRRFDRAYSTSSWTLPAHASLFTGLDAVRHGADQVSQALAPTAATLAEELAAAGYDTGGFSNNPWVSERRGTARGFADFSELFRGRRPPHGAPEAHRTVREVSAWLDRERDPERPWLLFVNLMDAHFPYEPRWEEARALFDSEEAWQGALARMTTALEPMHVIRLHYLQGLRGPDVSDEDVEAARRLYDAEIRYVDAVTEHLVREVERASQRPTLVAILSDHGESFGEQGHMGHAFSLQESLVRIVLLLRGPGIEAGSHDARRVQISDLFPTFLRAAGLPVPTTIDGVDLLAPQEEGRGLRALYAHPLQALASFPARFRSTPQIARLNHELRAGIAGDHKLVRSSDGSEQLFDLRAEPERAVPLAGAPDALVRRLRDLAGEPRTRAALTAPSREPVDPETQRALEALGYLEPEAASP